MDERKCYGCQYRGRPPGTAHSCCRHPDVQEAVGDPLANVLAIFASVGRTEPLQAVVGSLDIQANYHGIKNGWFNWPWNFDPTWLENCDGFTAREVSDG
jgi:hypothetical protein